MFGPQVPTEQQTEVEPDPQSSKGDGPTPSLVPKEGSRRVGNLSNVQNLLMSVYSYRKVTTTAQLKTLSTIFRRPQVSQIWVFDACATSKFPHGNQGLVY